MKRLRSFIKDTSGDAVVEATILFPIIIMIFAGLVLLSMYLPTRASLQEATQTAATALAVERSDSWLFVNPEGGHYWETDSTEMLTVYEEMFATLLFTGLREGKMQDKADTIVKNRMEASVFANTEDLAVECEYVNFLVYKEVVVTATNTITMPVDLSFVRFPKELVITAESKAVVQDGDDFARNMDFVKYFVKNKEKLLMANLKKVLEKELKPYFFPKAEGE